MLYFMVDSYLYRWLIKLVKFAAFRGKMQEFAVVGQIHE